MKRFFYLLAILSALSIRVCASGIAGFWVIPDSKTNNPESVAYFYESGGVFTARMVLIYDDSGGVAETFLSPKERAKGIKSHPFICGLDFITGLKLSTNGRYVGTVVDPDTGKKYKCEVWYDSKSKKLAVRGELFIFGVTNYWPPIASENLPKEVVEEAAKFSGNPPRANNEAFSSNAPENCGEDCQYAQRRERPRFYRVRHY